MKFTIRETPHPNRKGEAENDYGYQTVEIVQFNYDGKGGVIAIVDGELAYMEVDFLEFLIGGKWYSNSICSDEYAT